MTAVEQGEHGTQVLERDPGAADEATPPAAKGSALAALRKARQERLEELVSPPLKVPRTDPPIYVRYAVLSDTDVDRINKTTAAEGDVIESFARGLARACRGIGEVVDGEFVSLDPKGSPLLFNDRLRELLELEQLDPPITSHELVRQLYAADGDVRSTIDHLLNWSGFNQRIIEADVAGN